MIGDLALQPAGSGAIEEWFDRRRRAMSAREEMTGHWLQLAKYIQPRKYGGFVARGETGGPEVNVHADLFDSSGVDANQALARGQLSWMTPKESPWFKLSPPKRFREVEEVANWYADTTLELREMLAGSNFYTEVHELYLDRGGFGTSALYSDYIWDEDALFFKVLPLQRFVAWENARRLVDSVAIDHVMTARQVAQMFPLSMLSDKLRELATDARKKDQQVTLVQFIFPRAEAEKVGPSGFAMAWDYASLWAEEDTKHVIAEGGYHGMPVQVTRFLRWEGLRAELGVWGWSPAWAALPDLKQLNHLERQMDALAERMVSPPLLVPDYLEGRPDLRPGGQTLFKAEFGEAGKPATWADKGRFDVGQLRAETRRERIDRHFMVRLFEMLAQIDAGKMTAFETQARLQEKVDQFSPTFDLVTTELLSPQVKRAFFLGLKARRFRPPPRQLVEVDPATGQATIPEPNVEYTSRIALAIAAASVRAAESVIADALEVSKVRPEVLDNFDLDHAFREKFRSQGGAPIILRPEKDRDAMRQARAQAEAQAAAAQAGPAMIPEVGDG